MNKRYLSIVSLLAVFALIVAACSSDDSDDTTTTTTAPPAAEEGQSVLDLAVEAGQFSTLIAAIDAAGLNETLEGEGPFTVLAPTDAAFDDALASARYHRLRSSWPIRPLRTSSPITSSPRLQTAS